MDLAGVGLAEGWPPRYLLRRRRRYYRLASWSCTTSLLQFHVTRARAHLLGQNEATKKGSFYHCTEPISTARSRRRATRDVTGPSRLRSARPRPSSSAVLDPSPSQLPRFSYYAKARPLYAYRAWYSARPHPSQSFTPFTQTLDPLHPGLRIEAQELAGRTCASALRRQRLGGRTCGHRKAFSVRETSRSMSLRLRSSRLS